MLGQLVMAARGQKDSFTITGTEHPTRDGTGIRDYIHVWDLAQAHVRAVERFDEVLAEAGGPSVIINVGRGDGVTVRELVAAFERVFGHDVPITRGAAASGRRRGCLRQRRPGRPAPRLAAPSSPSTTPSPRRWRGATAARKSWATSDPAGYVVALAAALVAASVGLATPASATARLPGRGAVGRDGGLGVPLSGRTVVIDPGHQLGNHNYPRQINRLVPAGGFKKPCNTTGTADQRRLPGGDVHLAGVARLLKHRLEALGATVLLTRHSNREDRWGPCVDVRGRAGNKLPADLKISIHGDGSYAAGAHGFHVIAPTDRRPWTHDIFSRRGGWRSTPGPPCAVSGCPVANYIAGGDGLDFRSDLGTLNLSDVPTVMVELGNMRNAGDAQRMTSAAGRATYARGLADAVRTYLG